MFKKIIVYLQKTTNGMALGLFSTLIIGVIIEQFGKLIGFQPLLDIANFAKGMMGVGIGLGVALSLKKDGLVAIAGAVAGYISVQNVQNVAKPLNDPLCAYIGACLAIGAIILIMRKKTPVDIFLIPLIGLAVSFVFYLFGAYYVHWLTTSLAWVIEKAMSFAPYPMSIVISVLMGMALTAPISSAAIAITLNMSGLAAGAALIGCSVQMIGFAIHSIRDNKWGTIIALAIGTSMLQFKNIIKKPLIWVPTIVVSALLGPLAILFNLQTNASGAGMGTSGLVGQITAFQVMGYSLESSLKIILITVVAPAVIIFAVDFLFRHFKLFVVGDFAVNNIETVERKVEAPKIETSPNK